MIIKIHTKKMYNIRILSVAALMACSLQVHAQRKTISQRVDSLLRLMKIEEKIGQLNQYSGKNLTGPLTEQNKNVQQDIKDGLVGSMLNVQGAKDTRQVQEIAMQSRLKIPLLFSMDVVHGYKTIFPVPLAESASWDMDMIRQSAHIAAKEAAAAGLHWTFAPMVDIARDPRWGRIMEGAGEDTYLGSQIAKARVLGFQGEKLGGVDAVMACAKHFAAYGAVLGGRDYAEVEMSDRELWETYLPPFRASQQAGVATFMSAFNTLNGVPTAASDYLQRDILKGKWGYKGFIVSDWGSIDQMMKWGYVADKKEAALKAMLSGCDMDMVSKSYLQHLKQLVDERKISIKLIDDAVRRILTTKFELGLFDDPYRFSLEMREKETLRRPAHLSAARQMAQRSIVLLKNKGNLLPLRGDRKNIAVIGPLADTKRDMLGNWTGAGDPADVVTLMEGLKTRFGKDVAFTFLKGTDINSEDTSGIGGAVALARKSDLVIMALGESGEMSGESRSRAEIGLPGRQQQLFDAVQRCGKPVVAILMAGRPMIFEAIAEKADAIVYGWFLGDQAGHALADVLSGDYNPSAKLPVTFPRSVGQIPLSYQVYRTGHPQLSSPLQYQTGYIDLSSKPRYAFGYGLSYTEFQYSGLTLSKTTMGANEIIIASFQLRNTGKVAGEEIVQLYLNDVLASVVQPLKKLKDFQKIALKAGETKTVTFKIDVEKLSFYNQKLAWGTEPGKFTLMIGSASDDIKLSSTFELK